MVSFCNHGFYCTTADYHLMKEGNEAADSVSVEGSLNKETELTGNPETSTNKSQESEIGSTNDL
jgi:hypothetical protein